ncbi:hypothetical protein XELAEV_18006753mg [Xenopus laevis]|uniref:Uncharacterized protein n=1 Tax=Xenopus laevis TaxID=8355 RepID=A0A974DZV2_XENLA|nr:hypothetical protein XELAEV_18006753mg [Xenopus laevis]
MKIRITSDNSETTMPSSVHLHTKPSLAASPSIRATYFAGHSATEKSLDMFFPVRPFRDFQVILQELYILLYGKLEWNAVKCTKLLRLCWFITMMK